MTFSKPLAFVSLSAIVILVAVFLSLDRRTNRLHGEIPAPPLSSVSNEQLREQLADRHARATHGFVSRRALEEMSRLYHANGYLAEAADCYRILIEEDPENPRWSHYLARIVSGYGMLDRSIELYQSTVQSDPSYLPARIQLGNALLKSNRAEEAEAVFREALSLDSTNAYALLGLGRIRIENQNWKEAKALLEAATSVSKNQIGIDLLVTVYSELGENEKAGQLKRSFDFGTYRDLADPWMDELLQVCYDPFRLATAGGMASYRGEHGRGVELLGRAISISPQDPMLHFQLAGILESSRDIEGALDHYAKSVQLKPDFADGWHNLYQIHRDGGNATAAQRTLEEGFRNCPDSPALLMEIAERHRSGGRHSQAIELLNRAISLRPNEAQAYLNLARIYLQIDRVEEGVAAMRKALAVEEGHPMALTTLALHAINTANQSEADRLMERIRNQPKVPPTEVEELSRRYQTRFGARP